ncbi:MAG TPA: hypothetical protein GXX59_02335 [Syntrophomonadaceae bacterium]|nr:hypothetical protein [Syntrophomonadaceae bacterium]
MEKKEALYIVFGGHTERIADYLKKQGYKIIGTDRTLDAAAIMATNLDEKPDTYLVLGSALVSGVVDVGINYGKALLDNLSKLRQAVPNSRIVLMLPEDVEPEVMQGIVYMGIYDIHKVKQISISQIPELLSQRKSYADYGVRTLPVPTKESNKSEIEIDDEEEKSKKILPFKGLIGIFRNLISLFARREKHREQKCLPGHVQEINKDRTVDCKNDEEPSDIQQEKREIETEQSIKLENNDINRRPVQANRKKVLCLGLESSQLAEQGIEVVSDPEDAQIIISGINGFYFAPKDKELIVIGTGTVADFAVKTTRPDAYIAEDIEDALTFISKISYKKHQKEIPVEEKADKEDESRAMEKPIPKAEKKPDLTVISSGRSSAGGHTLFFNSALYVVCPSRPAKAGEMAAEISKKIDNCALVCAASGSMGAISLGITAKDLICMDWRVPGSDAPVEWDEVFVWPVDPYKFLKINESPHGLIENIKPKFPLVVVDCAGEMDLVNRVSNKDGIIVLYDEMDSTTSYWLKNYAGSNVFPASVSEAINIIPAENGFVLTKQDGKKVSRVQG